MLSSLETNQGLTVMAPKGQPLRLPRTHNAFQAVKSLLLQPLPADQAWARVQELLADPLKLLVAWAAAHGFTLSAENDGIRLQGIALGPGWKRLLQRTHLTAGSPAPIVRFAQRLGADAYLNAAVDDVCIHWSHSATRGYEPQLVRLMMLPDSAIPGDMVSSDSHGEIPFLVTYKDYKWTPDKGFEVGTGTVLDRPETLADAEEILREPVILGHNRTYRCDAGEGSDWLEDMSFDSLAAARSNAKAIQKTGSGARIVNRCSGSVVDL